MKGIDVYHNESKNETSNLQTIPEKAYKESDFCIVKSTQGISYSYTKFFHAMIKRVLNDGKLAGAYHYAAGNDAKKEADYFIATVKPYLGKIILCLDWESYQNKAWGSKTWCKTFIDRVKAQTGITCFLYTGTDGMKQNSSLAGKVPLWFAGYPKPMSTNWTAPAFKYNLGDWKEYTIWQFTSSGEKIDRNISPLTAVQWREYASGKTLAARCLELMKEYHEYIKKHGSYFYRHYDSSLTTFAKAKAKIEKKEKVGLTCVVPLRWALDAMEIRTASKKALISATDGSFAAYYTGDMKDCLTRITTGNTIGKTVKQAVDSKLLKPGDIICYHNHTHTSVYTGDKYDFYEGGSQCVKDGHYPNGIKVNYESYPYKISEILRWKSGAASTTTTKETKTVAKAKTADALLKQAEAWKGCKESDGSHKKIIDVYNSHTPRARGYKVKYTDPWCATFVSACAIATGMTDIIPLECSCDEMIALAKKKGIWIENENRIPSPGEFVLYNWQDTGKGDDKGDSEHVGIAKEVKNGKTIVIEGNYEDEVKERTIAVNGRYIRGYIAPKYDKATSTTTPKKTTKPTIEQAAANVIDGKYGNGDARQKALKNLGFTTAEITKIQTLVNQKLKASSKSKKPSIEQAVKNVIDGKYGNGDARIKALTKLGFTAAERKKIQDLVNKKLK